MHSKRQIHRYVRAPRLALSASVVLALAVDLAGCGRSDESPVAIRPARSVPGADAVLALPTADPDRRGRESAKALAAPVETERLMALQVLEALGESAIGDAVPAIGAALGDPSVQVRALAARVLGGAGPGAAEEAVARLSAAVDDRAIRDAAVDALGRLGPAAGNAVPVLVRVLEDSTERPALRRRAAAALRRIEAGTRRVEAGLRALAAGSSLSTSVPESSTGSGETRDP